MFPTLAQALSDPDVVSVFYNGRCLDDDGGPTLGDCRLEIAGNVTTVICNE